MAEHVATDVDGGLIPAFDVPAPVAIGDVLVAPNGERFDITDVPRRKGPRWTVTLRHQNTQYVLSAWLFVVRDAAT